MSALENKRVPNFMSTEKSHLIRIIANKYRHILKDKQTNRTSVVAKNNAWRNIELDFNSTSTCGIPRSAISLKKCYENRKKELRKTLAEERREVFLTGGGPPHHVIKDESDELLMSIVNKKSLIGMIHHFDDDAEDLPINVASTSTANYPTEYVLHRDNIHLENESENHFMNINSITLPEDSENAPETLDWSKYTPLQLKTPMHKKLIPPSEETDQVTDKTEPVVKTVKRDRVGKTLASSRRRPTTTVKTLTSSHIAKKYDLLLDKRLKLVDEQLKHMQEENPLIIKKRQLEVQLLEIELSRKK